MLLVSGNGRTEAMMSAPRSDLPLEGRVALVTGAARGIGRGIALGLADAGADVVLADLDHDPGALSYELSGKTQLDATTAEVAARGPGQALGIGCDVTRADQVESLVRSVCERLGGIDVLVNNAGVVHFAPLVEIEEERWDQVFAVNVKGAYLVCRAAIPSLVERQGCIVNIASVAGKRGYPLGSLYCASKFAVVGLTQSLAAELGPQGVRVNAICPGILATHMWTHHLASEERGGSAAYEGAVAASIPLGRAQTPEDIADAVRYLALAPNVTGVSLNVAGGMEVW